MYRHQRRPWGQRKAPIASTRRMQTLTSTHKAGGSELDQIKVGRFEGGGANLDQAKRHAFHSLRTYFRET